LHSTSSVHCKLDSSRCCSFDARCPRPFPHSMFALQLAAVSVLKKRLLFVDRLA